jgi:hypothetical protein
LVEDCCVEIEKYKLRITKYLISNKADQNKCGLIIVVLLVPTGFHIQIKYIIKISVYILNSLAIQYPAADENEEKQRLSQVIIQNEIVYNLL